MIARNFDRSEIVGAMVVNDPHLARLAHTSATFAHGLDRIVQVACMAVAQLAEEAEDVDAERAARIDAAERGLLSTDDWLAGPPKTP